jgi:hypothetical protein
LCSRTDIFTGFIFFTKCHQHKNSCET